MTTLTSITARIKTPLLLLATAAALLYAWRVEQRAGQRAPERGPSGSASSTRSAVNQGGIAAEARLVAYPGAEVVVGTDIGGTIETLTIHEKDVVPRGKLLAAIRADDLRAELAQAEARGREIDADIRLNEYELTRSENLLKAEAGTRQQYDKAQRDLSASRARRATVEADIARIRAIIAKTQIVAPLSGTVTIRHVEPGETVPAGARIVTIADLRRTRVEAEVDEFDVARVKVGDPVSVSAEGFDRQWSGRVEEVPDVVSQRRIKPQDPSRPTDARVLLVKVALNGPTPLKLGQRLEVRIKPGAPPKNDTK